MQTLSLVQHSPEWHLHRAHARNASDAPAVLDCSPYTSRPQLLAQRHTGLRPEVDASQQRRFDDGHAIEASQLEGAEGVIGESLYPVIGIATVDGVVLSASFDGLTIGEDVVYECNTLNDDLRAVLAAVGGIEANDGRNLPKHYRVQLEQQLAVCGGERALFVAATKDGNDVRRCWYYPDLPLRAEIIAGWRQFDADLANYVHADPVQKVRAEAVEDFPVLLPIKMTGDVAIQHDLGSVKAKLKSHLAGLPKDPKTDQEFANLDDSVSRRDALEKALKAERERALRGSPNIAALLIAIDEVLTLSRDTRLEDADKVKTKKEKMRLDIRTAAQAEFDAHVRMWNEKLGRPLLSTAKGTCPDAAIAQEMHGKKSVKGWREGASKAVNDAKIAVTLLGEKLQANLAAYAELCTGQEALFRDVDTLLFKDSEAFRVICAGRIAEAQRQAEAKLEAEREKIRAEEQAKAAREQQEKEARERREREAQEAQALQAAQAAAPVPTPAAAPIAAPAAVSPAPNVVPMPSPRPNTPPSMTLGDLKARIAPLAIDAAGLAALGFPPAATDKSAKLYHAADFPRMVDSIVAHLRMAQQKHLQVA